MNYLFSFTNRTISARFIAVVTLVSLIMSAFPAAFLIAEAQGPNNKIDICHWSEDDQKFEFINVSKNSIGNAHGAAGSNDGDIIPVFDNYPGQNLGNDYNGKTGAEVLDDDCEVPDDESVDYCDPTQKPGGMSIAEWHDQENFDGSDCFKIKEKLQCGSLDVKIKDNDTPYEYSFHYVIGTETPENFEDGQPLPVTFTEDENGGSVEVTYYITGPEKDYFVGSDVPNFWDKNGKTVTVNTDCEEEPTESPLMCSVESDGTDPILYIDTSTDGESQLYTVNNGGLAILRANYDERFHSIIAINNSGEVYSASRDAGSTLVELEVSGTSTGVTTPVGPTNIDKPVAANFAPDDTLYILDQNGNELFSVDASDGSSAELSTNGDSLTVNGGDLVVNDENELIYVAKDGTVYLVELNNANTVSTLGNLSGTAYTSMALQEGVYYAFDKDSDQITEFTISGGTVNETGSSNVTTDVEFGDATSCLNQQKEPEKVTIVATKIICEDENLLPDDGFTKVDADTAQEFLDGLPEEDKNKCRLSEAEEFEFQWALGGVATGDAPDNDGELAGPWQSPVATNGDGEAIITVSADELGNNSQISMREVMDTDYYLPFTGVGGSDVSAELYCHNDAGNFDNLEWVKNVDVDNTYHCVAWNVPLERESDVTMCKYDEEQNPLSGWTLMLLGDEVDSLEVPAGTDAGVDSVALTGGLSYVAIANGTWDNNRGPLNIVDAEYSTEDNWLTWMDGFIGFPTDILELFIGNETDPASEWGTYNSNHRYAQSFVPGVDGPMNFSINDTNYTDNTGSLNVDLYTGYAGITGENGCVTFEDVPYGTYNADEVMLDDWKNLSGLGEIEIDEEETRHTFVNQDISKIPVATLMAEKVVCEAEEYLPNWNDENSAPDITETTAAQYVADSEGKCWLEDDWYFEWASQSTNNPDNDLPDNPLYGAGGAGWTQFGPTDGTGKAQVSLTAEDLDGNDSHIWVREVLQEGYIPFTFGPNNQTNEDDETAELYCHTDHQNYDNYDRIDDIAVDNTYHCVAFNTEIERPVVQCELDIYSDTSTLVEDTNEDAVATYDGNSNWTADIPGATWIWATEQVENPESDETYTFVETFEVDNPTEATITVAHDNWVKLYVNGVLIDDRTGVNGYQNYQIPPPYDILSELEPGENRIEFEVTNEGLDNSNYRSNPAGVLFHISALGDADSCERTTEPDPDEMYLIDGYKYEGQDVQESLTALILDYDNGLSNWTIELYDGEGDFITSTTTDNEGYYYFWVEEGEYEVREVVKPGWTQVGVDDGGDYVYPDGEPYSCSVEFPLEDDDYPVFNSISLYFEDEVITESDYRCDFYNVQEEESLYSVAGTKYEVFNGDNATARSGWTIYAGNGLATTSTITDNSGNYSFELPEGEWEIFEAMPTGWFQYDVEQNGSSIEEDRCEFDLTGEVEGGESCDFYNEQDLIITTTSGGGNGSGTRLREPEPEVAGATTMCPFLEDHMQMAWENDAFEVMKLKMFLNMIMGESLTIDGNFDAATSEAVKRFQEQYRDEILDPWFEQGIVPHNDPTGFVYKTTKWKINDIVCPGFEPYPSFDGEDLTSNVVIN